MVISPDYIIKVLSSEADAKNLCEGNLILRSRHYYLNCAGEAKDELESRLNYKRPSEYNHQSVNKGFINDYLLFCAHGPDKQEQSQYGKFGVRISNPCSLKKEIREKFELFGCMVLFSIFGKIRYSDFEGYEPKDSVEYYCDEDNIARSNFRKTYEIAYSKRICFEKDKEVRMIFDVKTEKLIPTQDLEVKFCKREDSKNPPKEFRDYKEWCNSKCDDDIGREDYWFEIYMKVSNNYFSRL